MVTTIIKRDGRTAQFDESKIAEAVEKAFQASGAMQSRTAADEVASRVVQKLEDGAIEGIPTVEERAGHRGGDAGRDRASCSTAKAYILYRAERTRAREMNTRLMKTYGGHHLLQAAKDSDIKRENANIDGDTAMGTMLKYGSEGAKQFYEMFILNPEHSQAHRKRGHPHPRSGLPTP